MIALWIPETLVDTDDNILTHSLLDFYVPLIEWQYGCFASREKCVIICKRA